MKTNSYKSMRRITAALAAGLVLGGIFAGAARAADMYHPGGLTYGGGINPSPVITQTYTTSNSTFSWYGMRGFSTILLSTNNPVGPFYPFVSTKATEYAWSVTAANPDPTNNFFFTLVQTNGYASSAQCSTCHGDKYAEWSGTAHASAIKEILNTNGTFQFYRNASCLPCHTVGDNKPTGYVYDTNAGSANYSSTLANVGCEDCHGPAGWHRYSDHAVIRPAVSIDPQICGSCHQDIHHPTYEEYTNSLHGQVNDDVKYGYSLGVYYTNTINLLGTNLYGYYVRTTNADGTLINTNGSPATNATTGIISSLNGAQTNANLAYVNWYDPGQDRAASCGVCHSGATRMALLSDYEARQNGIVAPLSMPTGRDSGSWGPTCAVCHDPHAATNPSQLRNPKWSTNYFTMPTTTDKRTNIVTGLNGTLTTNVVFYGTTFATFYDPNVSVCGQCHNSRGARWDGYSYNRYPSNVVATVTNTVYYNTTNTVLWTQTFTNYSATGTFLYVTNITYTNNTVSRGYYVTNSLTTNVVYRVLLTNSPSYSRPPHHSPQYNLLTGIVQPDYLNTNALGVATNMFGVHSLLTNGCATCHMQTLTVASPTGANPNYSGHEFDPLNTAVGYAACASCHNTNAAAPDFVGTKLDNLQLEITNSITLLVSNLNRWAFLKGTNVLGAANYNKSLANSWEYTTPGALATITNAGPGTTTLQLQIPTGIRQARFNLYMVSYGKSLGVHNPTYARFLLNTASNLVWQASQ
jgi:formate-dependent nitrite reductase cytochrome c552 subunit